MLLNNCHVYFGCNNNYYNSTIDCEVIIIQPKKNKESKNTKKHYDDIVTRLYAINTKYFRQLNRWSQQKLAEKIGSDKNYISEIENAQRKVSSTYISKLVKAFEIEPQEMLIKRDFNPKSRVDSRK